MALTVPAMSHTTHENNSLMNAHPSTFWPQSNHISSSAPVDAYVQSGSPPSPSHHGHQAYYDENNMMMNMMEMQRNYLLTGSGSPPMNGSGEGGRAQRSGSATGSGNRTPSRNSSSQDQYSAQLYKTELCRSFKDTGYCRYGLKCRFAHGTPDLRPVQRHKKYKTEKCKNYQRDGNCPYGDRCRFLHEDGELEELLLAEQMDGLVQATVSGTGSQNTSVPASPYFTATGSPPQENELDLRGAHHLYESGTSSRFNATKPITTARGSMIGSTPPHHSYHPHNPYAQHNTSQSVPTNLDLHPSLYRRGQELTGSISTDFSYGSPHITYGGNDDDEVLGRLDDDDGWMTHQQRVQKKQQEHARQQYQQQQQQTFQQHLDVTTNNNDDYNSFNSHLTQHHSPLLLHRGNQSSDDIDRLTDDVMDAQSAVRSAFTTSDMTSFHSQSTPVSLGSTPTAPTRSPLLLSAVPRSPIIGPSVWSTTVTETRTAGSTPGHATPTGFSTAPRSSTSIPSSSQGSPFFSSLIPPSGRSTGAMPAFSLSSSAQPIPGVSHMRSTSGNISRTQALAMEMTKGTDEAVGDDDLLSATSSRRKKAPGTSFLSATRAPQLSMDGDDVDELDLHALIINDVTPTAFSASDEDTPATGRFRSVSLNLPTHTSSQAIAINATSTSTSTTTSTASWYGSATASPTSSSSNQSPHANAFSHSFSLPSAATTLSTSVPRGIPSPLQRFQAPLQSTSTTITSSSTSGSSSPSAAPSSPHGPMGSTPSSANSSSRRLRIFANLTTAQQQQQQQQPSQPSQQPTPSFTLPVLGTSPNPPSLVPTTESTPNPSPGSDVS